MRAACICVLCSSFIAGLGACGAGGMAPSQPAAAVAPSITTQPADQSIGAGQTASDVYVMMITFRYSFQ